MTIVLDASVTLNFILVDESTVACEAVFDQVGVVGATVPSLWRFEVANGLLMAVRRGRIDIVYRDEALYELGILKIIVDPETSDRAWSSISTLAYLHGLTIYDAAYLELALRKRVALASLDKKLRAAAAAGLELLGV